MKQLIQTRKKDIVETLNSLTWFAMDAAWMLEYKDASLILIIPTIMTGLILCFMEKKKSLTLINISILCWICMNISWMLSELIPSRNLLGLAQGCMVVGISTMGIAIYLSNDRSETFFHFKRSRVKKMF